MLTSERLDLTFAALADPTRRAILARLATGEASVQELAKPFELKELRDEVRRLLQPGTPEGQTRPV